MKTEEGSSAGSSNAPSSISSALVVDPLEVGQATNATPFNQAQTPLQVGVQLGDFIQDSNGFSQWGRIYGAQAPFAPYLCRNGYLKTFRSCLDGGTPGKCIGAIEKNATCSLYDIERERFSGWTAWKPMTTCNLNKKTWSRSCINITSSTKGDTSQPLCYGPAQSDFDCSVDPNNAALNPGLRFTSNSACVPYNPQTHQYTEFYEGCGGVHLYYSGSMSVQQDCYYPANATSGSAPICTGATLTKGCFVPGTTCTSASNAANILQPGTIFTTAEGGTCGIAINPTSATNPLTAWESHYTLENNADSQLCSAGKTVQKRKCVAPREVSPSCILGINELINGDQYDQTCNNQDLKQLVSCTHGTSYASLNQNGGWSDWAPSTGCMYRPGGGYFRLESRTCSNPAPVRAGAFCQGERTRQVSCQGPLDGDRLVILLSEALDSQAGIRTAVNSYVTSVRNKGAEVDLQVRSSSISVADLRNLIQSQLVLPSGKKPNSVLLIGAFPHARVDGKNASGQNQLIYSDLPYEAPSDRYYETAAGVYKMTPAAAGTKMSLQRVVFWIDFSTHSATSTQYSNSASKYLGFLNKMVAAQTTAIHNVSNTFKPKVNLIVDDFWSNQPHEMSSNVATLKGYIGTSRSNLGGLLELASLSSDMFILMAHANSGVVSFGNKAYLPSNDSNSGQIYSVSSNGSLSFFSGVPIKSRHMNFFDCYAGDPSAANNVVSSVLLNPQGTVISAVASTTSGALSNWNGWYYNNALSLQHTAATAFLVWSRDNHYDGGEMKFSQTPSGDGIQDLGNEWNTGLIKVGDPLYKPSQYSSSTTPSGAVQ